MLKVALKCEENKDTWFSNFFKCFVDNFLNVESFKDGVLYKLTRLCVKPNVVEKYFVERINWFQFRNKEKFVLDILLLLFALPRTSCFYPFQKKNHKRIGC
jgi:hypothetical protein